MTGSEGVVSGLQQRETRDAASTALLFTDHEPVGMETPARVKVEVEHWEETEREDTAEKRKGRGEEVDKETGAFKNDL